MANLLPTLVFDTMKQFYANAKKIAKIDFQYLTMLRKTGQHMADLLDVCNDSMKWYLLAFTLFNIVTICAPILALILANNIDAFIKGIFIVWVFVFVILYVVVSAPLCLINENRTQLLKIVLWKMDSSIFVENHDKVKYEKCFIRKTFIN